VGRPKKKEIDFEEALARLEQVAQEMERGQLPLEKLLLRFSEGVDLIRVCREKLNNAEKEMEDLSSML